MYNVSFRIVKDSFIAEDIMQESFLTAFSKLNDLKNAETFGSWLKRIVVNNSISYYKREQNHIEVGIDKVLYKIEDDTNLEEAFETQNGSSYKNIKNSTLKTSLASIKESYEMALTLHYIEGYDYDEMCEILNISYANCRTLLSRAKASLKKKLQHAC